jgi:membrane protease YdiL (CAAX protease family)
MKNPVAGQTNKRDANHDAPNDARSGRQPADRSFPSRSGTRILALAEVLLAFAVVHVAYRAIKHFTKLGQHETAAGLNFSAGLTMILFTVGVLLLFKKDFAEYGLALKDGAYHLNVGLLWGILVVLAAGTIIRLAAIQFDPLHPPDARRAVVFAFAEIVNAILILQFLRRERPALRRVPLAISLLVLVMLFSLPPALALHFDRPMAKTLLSTLWLFFGAGFGEEIFFRGYIQSRINEAFGPPWRILGAEFGARLFVSAALFGFIHVLNTVDYFAGPFDFAWIWWLPNFASGLFFGLLREKTKSVLAGSIIHGITDVFSIVPALLPG